MKRLPIDPRAVKEVQSSPVMHGEQAHAMEAWGGTAGYRFFSGMPGSTRMVYAAILEGASDRETIEMATGLSTRRVEEELKNLTSDGFIMPEEEVIGDEEIF